MRKLVRIQAALLAFPLVALASARWDWGRFIGVLTDPGAAQEVAIIQNAYGDYIREMAVRRGDLAFLVNKTWIYFQNGRMLAESNLRNSHRYDSLFTEYNRTGPVDRLPRERRLPRSRDLLNAMFGRTESQVRRHCVRLTFLGHEININRVCAPALRQVEREIHAAAAVDPEVRAFIEDMAAVYSFHRKNVKGSRTLSFHAYGLALDLIPASYGGKHANWAWSRAFNRRWYRIPREERWSPPRPVLEAFKRHGFIWGGDWIRFDAVHFEYRPEIAYPRHASAAPSWLGGSVSFYGIK